MVGHALWIEGGALLGKDDGKIERRSSNLIDIGGFGCQENEVETLRALSVNAHIAQSCRLRSFRDFDNVAISVDVFVESALDLRNHDLAHFRTFEVDSS